MYIYRMKITKILLSFFATIFFMYSCKKTDTTPPPIAPAAPVDSCANLTIVPVVDFTPTITNQTIGTITVKSPIGSGITYSIGVAFQSSPNFSTLAIGSYVITVKTSAGCIGKITVIVNDIGAKFYAVRTIVKGYCGPCHLNGTISGNRNYDLDNSIVAAWDRIKARTVDGVPSFMPQGGQLTAIDKQKIVDWVNAGHRITD
jgi:hypothetical protein